MSALILADQSPRHESFYATLKPYQGAPEGSVIRLKTGSLNIARCLAGYIDINSNRYAFAILLDRNQAKSIGWASQLRYDILKQLASSLLPIKQE